MKPRLIAAISLYNEVDNIKECLESITDVVDGVHVVDGRFMGYPSKEPYSTDATTTLASFWATKHHKFYQLSRLADYRQKTKRSRYFNTRDSDENTWFFIIDPDERFSDLGGFRVKFEELACKINPRTKKLLHKTLCIMMEDKQQFIQGRKPFPKTRLIRWEDGIHYEPNHWTIADKDGGLYAPTNTCKSPILPGQLVNLPYNREFKRLLERNLFRGFRLMCNSGNYYLNMFEKGSDKQAEFLETKEQADELKELLKDKMLEEVYRDFDVGFMSMVEWFTSGARQDPPTASELARGQIMGVLYLCGAIPNPYL